jgi:tetratricopeptide (TPR) repeat protein
MHFLAFGQWNTERILTIGRNALYFEDYVLSIQYFNQVIKIKPYLAEPYMYRAMAKIQLGDDIGAELDATEAIERNPFLPEAYYVRGYARRKATNYTDKGFVYSL